MKNKAGNEILFKVMPITEARKNPDGTYTTEMIFSTKYRGGSNQVEVQKINFEGKIIRIITRIL